MVSTNPDEIFSRFDRNADWTSFYELYWTQSIHAQFEILGKHLPRAKFLRAKR